jgi:hypothetical protein
MFAFFLPKSLPSYLKGPANAMAIYNIGTLIAVCHSFFLWLALTAFCKRQGLHCQGDQIGRIFAQWMIVFFGQFSKELHKWPTF